MKIEVRPIIRIGPRHWDRLKFLSIKKGETMSVVLGNLLEKAMEQKKYKGLENG